MLPWYEFFPILPYNNLALFCTCRHHKASLIKRKACYRRYRLSHSPYIHQLMRGHIKTRHNAIITSYHYRLLISIKYRHCLISPCCNPHYSIYPNSFYCLLIHRIIQIGFNHIPIHGGDQDPSLVVVDITNVAAQDFEGHLVDIYCFHALVEVLVPDVDLARDGGEGDALEALAHGGDLDFVVIKDYNELLEGPDQDLAVLVASDEEMLESMITI
jgi:hypothetical protein